MAKTGSNRMMQCEERVFHPLLSGRAIDMPLFGIGPIEVSLPLLDLNVCFMRKRTTRHGALDSYGLQELRHTAVSGHWNMLQLSRAHEADLLRLLRILSHHLDAVIFEC